MPIGLNLQHKLFIVQKFDKQISIQETLPDSVSLQRNAGVGAQHFFAKKRYRVAFHYIRYRSLTISLQRNAIADPPWQNLHSQDIDIKRGKEVKSSQVKLSCETSLFVVAPRTFGGGMATTWLLPLSHK